MDFKSNDWTARKVTIVGAGAVGATFAYALAQQGIADEIVIVDINRALAKGQALDLAHGLSYMPALDIHSGDDSDYADSHVIVITAGAKQNPGESRLELLQRNAILVERIVNDIVAQNSNAVILVVTNPVDVLTYIACRSSGWPRGRVIGSGTVLDSARFRFLLSRYCQVDIHNVHGYILGEHGDSEFAAWSMTNIGGIPIDRFCEIGKFPDWSTQRTDIEKQVKDSAYHVIDYKGSTHFAVGLAMVRIVGAILRNERSVLTVSAELDGEYGLSGVSLGVPCIISGSGIESILEAKLDGAEQTALHASASILQKAIDSLKNEK